MALAFGKANNTKSTADTRRMKQRFDYALKHQLIIVRAPPGLGLLLSAISGSQ